MTSLFVGLMMLSGSSALAERATILLGTVGSGNTERVNMFDGQLVEEQPGWFVELSQKAANRCNADIDFAFMPWVRVLKLEESGALSGGFNSSYREERTVFGVYPMINGRPDERRASKLYTYTAYTQRDRPPLKRFTDVTIVVERNASIIPNLRARGAKIVEVASYLSMLRMVAKNRATAAVGIEDRLEVILRRDKALSSKIRKQYPPIEEKKGYVMFSKHFYEAHSKLAECFWEESAQLRETNWFTQLRDRYRRK